MWRNKDRVSDLHEKDATWELVISDAVVVDPEGWLGFVVPQHVNDRVGTQLRDELALELRRIGSALIG